MKEILEILTQIDNTSGTNDKKAIIRQHKDNELFKIVVKYALDQDKSYNITTLPETYRVSSEYLFYYLDFLNSKRGCTMAQANELASRCKDEADREVVTRIVTKDLKCGAKAKVFNSVTPGWVYQVPYQRLKSAAAINDVDFENDYVVGQIKMDGMFSYMLTDRSFLTRNGKSFELPGVFNVTGEWTGCVEADLKTKLIWMGELLVWDETGSFFLPRKTGNGLINKFISGTGDSLIKDRICFVTWGYVTQEDYDRRYSETLYTKVLADMECCYEENMVDNIYLSKTVVVHSKEEAQDFYKGARNRDEEGACIKVANKLCWKDQQSGSPYGIKLKPEAIAEFEIIEAYYGDSKGKWADHLGGLLVKTSCGGLVTKIGGGFSDEERMLGVDWWNQHKGKIISGKYTGVTTDKTSRKVMKLEHSRFDETRFNEKDEADTLQYCLEAVKNA